VKPWAEQGARRRPVMLGRGCSGNRRGFWIGRRGGGVSVGLLGWVLWIGRPA